MRTPFQHHLIELGEAAACKLYGVSKSTYRKWRQGVYVPRTAKGAEIVRLSNGRVTFDGIYGEKK